MKEELGQGGEKFWAFENFEQGQMDAIVGEWTEQTRKALAKRSDKSQEVKTLLMVFDDVADRPEIVRSSFVPYFAYLGNA